jgi:hypothetical protein
LRFLLKKKLVKNLSVGNYHHYENLNLKVKVKSGCVTGNLSVNFTNDMIKGFLTEFNKQKMSSKPFSVKISLVEYENLPQIMIA